MLYLLPHSRSATPSGRAVPRRGPRQLVRAVEENVTAWALVVMMLLPLAEIIVRRALSSGIPGAAPIVQHLTLWVGFLGAALAARDDRLLAIATGQMLPGRLQPAARVFSAAVTAAVVAILFWGAIQLIATQRMLGAVIALRVPVWIVQVVLPFAFAAIALRVTRNASPRWRTQVGVTTGLAFGALVLLFPRLVEGSGLWPALAVVVVAGLAGAPIFAVLGGAAVLLFLSVGTPPDRK